MLSYGNILSYRNIFAIIKYITGYHIEILNIFNNYQNCGNLVLLPPQHFFLDYFIEHCMQFNFLIFKYTLSRPCNEALSLSPKTFSSSSQDSNMSPETVGLWYFLIKNTSIWCLHTSFYCCMKITTNLVIKTMLVYYYMVP